MKDLMLVTMGAAFALVALAIYRSRKSINISTYTLANGSWVLNWDAPATGTPPFTYSYQVTWTDPNTKQTKTIQSGTNLTSTSVILDPTKIVSQNTNTTTVGTMSSYTFDALVTAVNSVGDGPQGSLQFVVYDTPSVVLIANPSVSGPGSEIYPSNKTSAFTDLGNGTYTIKSLYFEFADIINVANLDVSLSYDGKTYKYDSTDSVQQNYHWKVNWTSFPAVGPNQQVTLNINVSNPAGPVQLSVPLTSPPPKPIAPSAPIGMNVKVVS